MTSTGEKMRGKALPDLPSPPQEFYSAFNFMSFGWAPLVSFSLWTPGHTPHQLQSPQVTLSGLAFPSRVSLHQGFLFVLLNVESSPPRTQPGTQELINIYEEMHLGEARIVNIH